MIQMSTRVLLVAILLAAAGCNSGSSSASDRSASAAATLEPWDPVDPNYKGCEGG